MKITSEPTYINKDEREELLKRLKEFTFNTNYNVTKRDDETFVKPEFVFFKALYIAAVFGMIYTICLTGCSYLLNKYHNVQYNSLLIHYIFIPIFGIFATKYWNEHSYFFEAWKQCSAQYNNLYDDFFSNDNKVLIHWYRRINLSFDLYDMQLNDHKSFQSLYNKTLYVAYFMNHPDEKVSDLDIHTVKPMEELKNFQNKLNKINGTLK